MSIFRLPRPVWVMFFILVLEGVGLQILRPLVGLMAFFQTYHIETGPAGRVIAAQISMASAGGFLIASLGLEGQPRRGRQLLLV